jgi:hypothetical protein
LQFFTKIKIKFKSANLNIAGTLATFNDKDGHEIMKKKTYAMKPQSPPKDDSVKKTNINILISHSNIYPI